MKQDLEQYVKITHGDILMPGDKAGGKEKEKRRKPDNTAGRFTFMKGEASLIC